MKVIFTCSTKEIHKYAEFYRATRKAILDSGCELTRDWLEFSIERAAGRLNDVEPTSIYEVVMRSIFTADLLIADVTVRSMSIGHQLTYALTKKKPILLLLHQDNASTNRQLFIEGSSSKLITKKTYVNIQEITPIVRTFIHDHSELPEKRFNLKLTNLQNKYLDWANFALGVNKTTLIHSALDQAMGNDSEFQKHLNDESK